MDIDHLARLRANVRRFLRLSAARFDHNGVRILDVAPQDHAGAREFFQRSKISTLDIDPASGADYIADLCRNNREQIRSSTFDVVVCTEVLEHTLDPFAAVREIHRVLRPGGVLLGSTPYNFRIHGPLPDCWRFTAHGLRALLSAFDHVSIEELKTPGRPLMPIQYTVTAFKARESRRPRRLD